MQVQSTLTRADGTQVVQLWTGSWPTLTDAANFVELMFLKVMRAGELLTIEEPQLPNMVAIERALSLVDGRPERLPRAMARLTADEGQLLCEMFDCQMAGRA